MNRANTPAPIIPSNGRLEKLISALGVGICGLTALTCLVAQSLGNPLFIRGNGLGLMAPSTAIALLSLSLLFFLGRVSCLTRLSDMATAGLSGLLLLHSCLIVLKSQLPQLHLPDWETPLTSTIARANGMSPMLMAFSTCLLLFACALINLLLLRNPPRGSTKHRLGILLSMLTCFVCIIIGASQLLGTQHFFSSQLRPSSPLSACLICLYTLSIALDHGFWSGLLDLILGVKPDPKSPEPPGHRRRRKIASLGVLASGSIVVLLSTFYLQSELSQARQDVLSLLDTISQLKAQDIANWKNERMGDLTLQMNNPYFDYPLTKITATPQGSAEASEELQRLGRYISQVRETYDYHTVTLYDKQGNVVFSSSTPGEQPHLCAPEDIADVLRLNLPVFKGLSFHDDGSQHIDFLAPLHNKDRSSISGIIQLHANPHSSLYNKLHWPIHTHTGETFLLERRQNQLVLLNPLGSPTYSGAVPSGIFEEINKFLRNENSAAQNNLITHSRWRGAPVLGTIRPIPGTPWHLVTLLSTEEAYEDMRGEILQVSIGASALLSILALSVGLIWRERTQRFQLEQEQIKRASAELTHRLGLVMQRANDTIFLLNAGMRLIDMNQKAEEMYGYTRDELLSMTSCNLRSPKAASTLQKDFEASLQSMGTVYETIHRRKDGTDFPVEISAGKVIINDQPHVFTIVRDITERRNQEKEIHRLNLVLQVIIRVHHAIIRITSREELCHEICRLLVEIGNFRIAWIGWEDAHAKVLRPVAVAGDNFDYVNHLNISTQETEVGAHCPASTAFRENRSIVTSDFLPGPNSCVWHDKTKLSEVQSCLSIPLHQEGKVVALLTVYSGEKNFFGKNEIELLENAANDVSFAFDIMTREDRRLLAEAALQSSESRLSFLISSTPAVIYSLSYSGSYNTTYISENIVELSGYAACEFLDNPNFWLSKIHPEDLAKACESMNHLTLGGQLIREYRFLHKDGAWRWLHDCTHLAKDATGKAVAYVGYLVDITERKNAENALKDLVKVLRVLNSIAVILDQYEVSTQDLVTAIARQIPMALQHPDLARVSIEVDETEVHSGAEGPLVEKISAPLSLNGRPAGFITVGYVQAHGDRRLCGISNQESDTINSIARTLGISLGARESFRTIQNFNTELEHTVSRRTTELAQRNREIQALLNAIPDMVMRINSAGQVLNIQQAHDSAALSDLVLGPNSSEQIQLEPSFLDACLKSGLSALSCNDTVTSEIATFSGTSQLIVELRAAPTGIEEFVVFARDITLRKKLESETAAMLDKEREVSEMKSRFISVTSHEFRTPITSATGALELLRDYSDRLTPEKRAELLDRINQSMKRMTGMLEELLTLSRIDSGRIKKQIKPVLLHDLLSNLIEDQRMADRDAHRFVFNFNGPDTPILSDPDILRHIITNLLSNAARYSAGGTDIIIDCLIDESATSIAVTDRGIGIPESDLPRIFDAFERADNVGEIKGSGLGLNIVHRMCEALGASISIQTSIGQGSTFTFRLPHLQPMNS